MTNQKKLSPYAGSLNMLIEVCDQSRELAQSLWGESRRDAIPETEELIKWRRDRIATVDPQLNDLQEARRK